jgi:hypothetical protein
MDEWHYQRGETTFGPISGETLHSLIKRGRLQSNTGVRRSDVAEWSTVAEVLPSLPPIPEAPPPEQFTNAQPFDSSLPGASAVYAPPQSTLVAIPQSSPPASLWIGMILCAGSLLFEIICWISRSIFFLSEISDTSFWPRWLHESSQSLTSFTIVSTAIGTITTAIWQGCAFASLKHLYGGMVRRSRASGLWWIIPIANLFLPLLCLREMRYLSRKRREVINPHASFGPLLITLETLILIRFPIHVLAALSHRTQTSAEFVAATLLVSIFTIIAFATILLIIVIANFRQQKRLYAHWNDDAYWQNPSRR